MSQIRSSSAWPTCSTDPVKSIATDHPLTRDQQQALKILAGLMIPASAEYQVPGADDQHIFADILRTIIAEPHTARLVVARLDELTDGDFAAATDLARQQAAQQFRESHSPLVAFFHALIAQCYYRDDRVMHSLDMEPRPPFPGGYAVEDGDWSLLDPVRARSPMYRLPPEE